MQTFKRMQDRWFRSAQPNLPPVTVTAFGFCVGAVCVTWQTVAEIWGYKADHITSDEAFLEFDAGYQRVSISEEQPGFAELEAAMIAVFPSTTGWRQAALLPAFTRSQTLLYRRS